MNMQQLRLIVQELATHEGVNETGIEGVQLYRISRPMDRTPAVFAPRVCFNVSGRKRVFFDGQVRVYDDKQFICGTIPIPVEADVPRASAQKPVLGVSLTLDEQLLTEMVVSLPPCGEEESVGRSKGVVVGKWNDALRTRLADVLELAGNPTARRVLRKGRLREVYYVLLQGGAGPLLRQRFGAANAVVDSIAYIKGNLPESFSVEELARRARMSKASFHRIFKQTTGISPLQFIKSLRLNTAAMLVASGKRVSEAAFEVGYSSPSQFSREFKRQFGKTPSEWDVDNAV